MSQTGEAVVGGSLQETAGGETGGPYKQPLEKYDLFSPPGSPFPTWLAGTLVPVVRTSSLGDRFHAPNFDGEEVGIACWNDETGDITLVVSELEFAEGWEEPCRCTPCRKAFAEMGLDVYDDLELALPDWGDEFKTPAVTSQSNTRGTAHAPANCDDPSSACNHDGGEEADWKPVEEDENDALTRCQTAACQEKFTWMDSQNRVVNTHI